MSKEEENKLRVSILKPFPDIRLGSRLILESDSNVKNLYAKHDSVVLATGESVGRNKLLMERLAKSELAQEWVNVVFKISGVDDRQKELLFSFLSDESKVITDNKNGVLYINTSLNKIINLLSYINKNNHDSNGGSVSDSLDSLYFKIKTALDRVIEMQIKIPYVFSSFYEDVYLKNN